MERSMLKLTLSDSWPGVPGAYALFYLPGHASWRRFGRGAGAAVHWRPAGTVRRRRVLWSWCVRPEQRAVLLQPHFLHAALALPEQLFKFFPLARLQFRPNLLAHFAEFPARHSSSSLLALAQDTRDTLVLFRR